MKKFLLMSVFAIGAANADIIPNLLAVTGGASRCAFDVGVGANVCTYEYTAQLHNDSELTSGGSFDEYFTIYDFNGYVAGSGTAPTGWSFSTADEGLTPSRIQIGADDDLTIPNLTFKYTGTGAAGGTSFTGFSAKSYNGPSTILDFYASQATKGPGDEGAGTMVQNVGQVEVPNPLDFPSDEGEIPEPMSMALIGGGLAALALLPRRFRK